MTDKRKRRDDTISDILRTAPAPASAPPIADGAGQAEPRLRWQSITSISVEVCDPSGGWRVDKTTLRMVLNAGGPDEVVLDTDELRRQWDGGSMLVSALLNEARKALRYEGEVEIEPRHCQLCGLGRRESDHALLHFAQGVIADEEEHKLRQLFKKFMRDRELRARHGQKEI